MPANGKAFPATWINQGVWLLYFACLQLNPHKNGELFRQYEGCLASQGPRLYQLVAGNQSFKNLVIMTVISKTKSVSGFATLFFVLLMIISGPGAAGQTQPKKGNLKVVVTNIRGNTGQIAFYLFNSGDDFPMKTGKALMQGFVKTAGSSAEYTFTNLAAGTFAVFVFHDADNDKKLKTNFVGMPKEGMGVSNNAKGHFGPPKYTDAKFEFRNSGQVVTIALVYL